MTLIAYKSMIAPAPSQPDGVSRVHVQVHVEAVIVGAEVARRRANVWLLEHVGNLIGAEAPLLIFSEPLVWRMDVVLTWPDRGVVGWVGRIDVNAVTGEPMPSENLIEELTARARAFASS